MKRIKKKATKRISHFLSAQEFDSNTAELLMGAHKKAGEGFFTRVCSDRTKGNRALS